MAKAAAAKGKSKEKDAPKKNKEATAEKKFGVADLAKLMSVKEASARVQLRNHSIPKAGKSYGWDTREELQKVADKLKGKKKAAGKKDRDNDDD